MAHDTDAITLLVAHGSRNPRAIEAHESLCVAVAARAAVAGAGSFAVRAAYLEINEPSIGAAIDSAIEDGATSVRIVPHFLAPGNHVAVDIPAIVEQARRRHPAVSIELTEHSGADPALVDLLAARVLH